MKAFGRVLCLLPLVSILHLSDALASTPRSQLLSKLPLRFEQERGKYMARGPNFVLGLSAAGNSLEWKYPPRRPVAVRPLRCIPTVSAPRQLPLSARQSPNPACSLHCP